MRIAYLGFEHPRQEGGVPGKISSQLQAWREAGHQVLQLTLGAQPGGLALKEGGQGWSRIRNSPTWRAFRSTSQTQKDLKSWSPDLIYLRQLLWWPGLMDLLAIAPYVVEINSQAAVEYRRTGFLKRTLYHLTGARLLRGAAGLVTVTGELAREMPIKDMAPLVLANGSLLPEVPPQRSVLKPQINLVFVGSAGQPWHGVDKVLRLATLLPDCDFHLVIPGGVPNPVPCNVSVHADLQGPPLTTLYLGMDIGIGTLALHRINMEEACPLKTREYLVHGLPILGAYFDPDLNGAPYYLRLPNREDNLESSLTEIKAFLRAWRGVSIPWEDVRARVDLRTKEAKRLAYFQQVCRART